MLNFVRRSKYHQVAGNYSITAYAQGKPKYVFLLWRIKPQEILGLFDDATLAREYANELEAA